LDHVQEALNLGKFWKEDSDNLKASGGKMGDVVINVDKGRSRE